MTRRRLFAGAAAAAFLALVAVGAVRAGRNGTAAAVDTDPLVPTTRVTRGSLELSVHATGELRASKSAMLVAPSVGGTLRILQLLDAGASVTAGEVVAEFDPTEQQYALEQARSELAEAEQQIVKKKADLDVQLAEDRVELLTAQFDVRRAELDNLADRELISANAYAKNQLALEQAKRRLEQIAADSKTRIDTNRAALALVEEKRAKAELAAMRAQQNIDSLVLRAPIGGLVVIRDNRDASGGFFFSGMTLPAFRAGDNTFAGRPIADVFDLSGMELRVQVGEQDRPNVTIGQTATVWPDALGASPLTARVTAIAGLASSEFFDISRPVRQFDVTLALDHPDPRLRPGTSVKVLLAGRRVDNALQVPIQAVRLKNGKPSVYVQTGAGFEAREVKVEYRTESRVGLGGLDENAVVALVDPVAASSTTASAAARPSGAVK